MNIQPRKVSLNCLLGKHIAEFCLHTEGVYFKTSSDSSYFLGHHRECCEKVYVEQSEGDSESLLGEVLTFKLEKEKIKGDCAWVFYKLTTVNGYNTFRFTKDLDTAYSTEVDLYLISPEDYPKILK